VLRHPGLTAEVIERLAERLAKSASLRQSRKVRIALVTHPHTPRHVSLPLTRSLHTLDLMKAALSPLVPADVKIAIEELLIARLKMVTKGERLTLARRASGRVAAALLHDLENANGRILDAATYARETRVMQIALDNPRLTEALVIQGVLHPAATAALVDAVARHPRWSKRKEIRAALLRTEHLSLARALEFIAAIPASQRQDLLVNSRLPEKIKAQLVPRVPSRVCARGASNREL
jgi:hypothetical protein